MSEIISPKKTLILGGVWAVGTRWAIRGVGFLNTVIMARLVLPADYGIVAMAYLVVALIQAIADFGATTALMRKKVVTREEIDSAWTLRIIQGIIVGILILIASPIASMYFNELRVKYVLWVLAVCVSISGAGNIGTTLAQKDFNFSLDFKLNVLGKLVGVLGTVAAGYYLRDYRALVIGFASSYIAGLWLSYHLHPYRPCWNTSKIKDIWALTKWLMLAGVGGFILRKGDEIIAARIGSANDYGLYNVGSDFGQMPTGEVGPALLRAFMPVLASLDGGVKELNEAVIKTLGAITTITFPIGMGFAVIAVPVTHLVLGPSWTGAAQYVSSFAILSTMQIVQNPIGTLFIVRGNTKIQSVIVWMEFVAFILASLIFVPRYFLLGLVLARMIGVAVNTVATFYLAKKYCEFPVSRATLSIIRPMLGSVIMYYLVSNIIVKLSMPVTQVVFGIVCGSVFFTFYCGISWLLVGRPEGVESTIVRELNILFKK